MEVNTLTGTSSKKRAAPTQDFPELYGPLDPVSEQADHYENIGHQILQGNTEGADILIEAANDSTLADPLRGHARKIIHVTRHLLA